MNWAHIKSTPDLYCVQLRLLYKRILSDSDLKNNRWVIKQQTHCSRGPHWLYIIIIDNEETKRENRWWERYLQLFLSGAGLL